MLKITQNYFNIHAVLYLVKQCLLMVIGKSPQVVQVPVKMETFLFAWRKFDETDTQRAKIKNKYIHERLFTYDRCVRFKKT